MASVGVADSIFNAEKIAENEMLKIEGPVFHRSDIGKKELIDKKLHHMNSIR